MTEIEERRRKQAIKVAITESFMLLVIIILVAILVMLSLGYNFNFGSGVETSGLVQINSIPSGAAITVDGEGMLFPTNQSKTMASGEHEIVLEREGYTSWSKTIMVTEGMLYRLYYPRLYKEERKATVVLEATTERVPLLASVSSNRKHMLLIYADLWQIIGLNDSEPKIREIDATSVIDASTDAVEIVEWADSSNRVLAKMHSELGTAWVLVNLTEPEKSLNLTEAFQLDFAEVKIANNSADKLFALADGQIREIDASEVEISKVLVSDVASFSNYGGELIYVSGGKIYSYTGTDTKPVMLYEGSTDAPLLTLINKYYGDTYLVIASGTNLYIYYGQLPGANEKFKNTMKLAAEETLDMTPQELYAMGAGELMVAADGQKLAVMDAENFLVTHYEAESPVRWLSDFDFYTVRDKWLTAWDFDNSNPHALVSGLNEDLPATISENNRYLYYFADDLSLVQMTIK